MPGATNGGQYMLSNASVGGSSCNGGGGGSNGSGSPIPMLQQVGGGGANQSAGGLNGNNSGNSGRGSSPSAGGMMRSTLNGNGSLGTAAACYGPALSYGAHHAPEHLYYGLPMYTPTTTLISDGQGGLYATTTDGTALDHTMVGGNGSLAEGDNQQLYLPHHHTSLNPHHHQLVLTQPANQQHQHQPLCSVDQPLTSTPQLNNTTNQHLIIDDSTAVSYQHSFAQQYPYYTPYQPQEIQQQFNAPPVTTTNVVVPSSAPTTNVSVNLTQPVDQTEVDSSRSTATTPVVSLLNNDLQEKDFSAMQSGRRRKIATDITPAVSTANQQSTAAPSTPYQHYFTSNSVVPPNNRQYNNNNNFYNKWMPNNNNNRRNSNPPPINQYHQRFNGYQQPRYQQSTVDSTTNDAVDQQMNRSYNNYASNRRPYRSNTFRSHSRYSGGSMSMTCDQPKRVVVDSVVSSTTTASSVDCDVNNPNTSCSSGSTTTATTTTTDSNPMVPMGATSQQHHVQQQLAVAHAHHIQQQQQVQQQQVSQQQFAPPTRRSRRTTTTVTTGGNNGGIRRGGGYHAGGTAGSGSNNVSCPVPSEIGAGDAPLPITLSATSGSTVHLSNNTSSLQASLPNANNNNTSNMDSTATTTSATTNSNSAAADACAKKLDTLKLQ